MNQKMVSIIPINPTYRFEESTINHDPRSNNRIKVDAMSEIQIIERVLFYDEDDN